MIYSGIDYNVRIFSCDINILKMSSDITSESTRNVYIVDHIVITSKIDHISSEQFRILLYTETW